MNNNITVTLTGLQKRQEDGHDPTIDQRDSTRIGEMFGLEWTASQTGRSPEEARKLLEAGFDCITDREGCKLLRKRK